MRRAIDASLQRHVVREILFAVARARPGGPDLAHVLPQRPRGFESRFPARHPVPLGVMVSLERGDAVAVPRDEGPLSRPDSSFQCTRARACRCRRVAGR